VLHTILSAECVKLLEAALLKFIYKNRIDDHTTTIGVTDTELIRKSQQAEVDVTLQG